MATGTRERRARAAARGDGQTRCQATAWPAFVKELPPVSRRQCRGGRPEPAGRGRPRGRPSAPPRAVGSTAIIVDNEPPPGNRPGVEAAAATAPFPMLYVHEPRRGISRARNAALAACAGRCDWIAFTDDDCQPAPDWLAAQLAAA